MVYDIPVEKLLDDYPDIHPYENYIWREKILSRVDVTKALMTRDLHPTPIPQEYLLEEHAKRVAYLAMYGWEDAIFLDFGVPELNAPCFSPVLDGYHRLAAAIYLKLPLISAEVSGSLDFAEELGLIKIRSWL